MKNCLRSLGSSIIVSAVFFVFACDVVEPPSTVSESPPESSDSSGKAELVKAGQKPGDIESVETVSGFEVRRLKPSDEPAGVLVLLHGYGSDYDSVLEVGRRLRLDWELVAPRGPRRVARARFSWYPLSFDVTGRVGQPESVDEAVGEAGTRLRELIAASKIDGKPLVVGGFSQGAMLALHVSTKGVEGLDGVVSLSGDWPRGTDRVDTSLAYFVAHGDADPLIPVERAERLSAGLPAERTVFKRYRGMRHTVGVQVVRDLAAWLKKLDASGD